MGGASIINAHRVCAIATELESACQHGDGDVAPLTLQLAQALESVHAELHERLEGVAAER
jgi:hypothetical protein